MCSPFFCVPSRMMTSRIFLASAAVFVNVVFCTNECGKLASSSDLSFPWNVGIYLEFQNEAELVCLGSLIQSNAVLTAAHCFCDNIGKTLRNGSFHLATGNLPKRINLKSASTSLVKVDKTHIHIHKYYSGFESFLENDLAIIKDTFHFSSKVAPVCFDWSGEVKDNNLHGKQAIWNNNKIKIVEQAYLQSEDCYNASENFISFITSDKSCTNLKTSGIPLTHESEGAGLVSPHSNQWYIKGVISMHDVTKGQISTYTNVNQYLNWISNICAT